MLPYALQSLGGWRNEACAIPITVPGVDLTGQVVRAQVRENSDNPVLTLDLPQTADPSATGIRFVGVTYDAAGVPTSSLMWQVTKVAMQGLPFAGELGAPWIGSYALQFGGVTRMAGSFAAVASPIDSDSAPANRAPQWGSTANPVLVGGVILTIAQGGVTVSIAGVDLITPLVSEVKAQAAAAKASADRAANTIGQGVADVQLQAGRAVAAAGQASMAATALLTLSSLYVSTAAGLAATAEGKYFGVPGAGNVFVTAYQRVNGAAVAIGSFPSTALLNSIGVVPALVSGDQSIDCAVAINAALADPTTIRVILPPGTFWTRQEIKVPSGKELWGSGRGVTTLVAHPTFVQNRSRGFTGVVVADSALAPRVRDLTINGNKLPSSGLVKGVIMYRTRDFLVERIEVINTNSYAYWASALFGDADAVRSSGVFRTVRAVNFNVGFEASNALDVLFDDMEWSGGDNDIGCEAVYHALAGSKRITYRRGRQIGPGTGIILEVLANEQSDTTDIKVIDCDGFSTGNQIAISISAPTAGQRVERVLVQDSRIGGTSVGVQTDNCSLDIKGCAFDFQANEGINAGANSTIMSDDTRMKITTVSAQAAAVPFQIDPSSTVRYTGGSIRFNCAAGLEQTAYGGNLYVSPTTQIVRGATGMDRIVGETPMGIGSVVKRSLAADQAFNNGDTLFQFGTGTGAEYRVRVRGVLVGGAATTGLVMNSFNGGGGTTRSASGIGLLTANSDGSFAGKSNPIYDAAGDDGSAIYAAIGNGKRAGVSLDFTLTTNGQNSVPIAGQGSGTLLAGATFEVERTK